MTTPQTTPTDEQLWELSRQAKDDPRCADQHWFILFAHAAIAASPGVTAAPQEGVSPAEQYRTRYAKLLHYPEHWDTAVYPTIDHALAEVVGCFSCSECTAAAQPPAVAAIPEPSDGEVDLLLSEIDQIARNYDHHDYGLPTHDDDSVASMRAQVQWFFESWTIVPQPSAGQQNRGEADKYRDLLLEWLDGMYDSSDFLRRVKLACGTGVKLVGAPATSGEATAAQGAAIDDVEPPVRLHVRHSEWKTLSPEAQAALMGAAEKAVANTRAQRVSEGDARANFPTAPLTAGPAEEQPTQKGGSNAEGSTLRADAGTVGRDTVTNAQTVTDAVRSLLEEARDVLVTANEKFMHKEIPSAKIYEVVAKINAALAPQDRCQACGAPTPCNCNNMEGLG